MTYREITSVNAEFEAMDMVKIRGEGRPLRVHKSGDGVHKNTIGKICRGQTWIKPRSKLTADQIRRIRYGSEPVVPLARELGMSHTQVYRIRAGTTHLGFK